MKKILLLAVSITYLILTSAAISDMIAGRVFDKKTGGPLNGVDLLVIGNESGTLWNGTTQYNPFSQQNGEYSTGHNLTWVNGEKLTVDITNTEDVGYWGNATDIAPNETDIIFIDVYATDARSPQYLTVGADPNATEGHTVYSVWSDNSGVYNVTVNHNATGVFHDYNTTRDGINHTYTFTNETLAAAKKISWRFTAYDTTGNVNTSMPYQSIIHYLSIINYEIALPWGWSLISLPIL